MIPRFLFVEILSIVLLSKAIKQFRKFNYLFFNFYFMFYKKNLSLAMAAMLLTIMGFRAMAQNIQVQIQSNNLPGGYHVPCNGNQSAAVQAIASGGQEPYSYLWSNGSTQASLNGLGAGNYQVTVTDALGSSVTTGIQLFEPNVLTFEKVLSDYNGYQLRGAGRSDGSILLIPSGGTAPYSVSWSNGDNSFGLSNLAAGNYSFTLTDANGCVTTGSTILEQPAPITATLNVLQPVSCNGAGDGIAEIQASGGVPPYRIFWSNGSMEAQAARLSGGDNQVQVEDANGIIFETVLQLSEPSPLTASLTSSSYPNGYEVSCYNCFNGSIQTNVTGGTAPYTFDWGNTANSSNGNLNGLDGGLYSVKITDAHGCFVKENISLKMPDRNDWTMSGNQNVDPQNQFIGTLDNSDVVFKTNAQERLRVTGAGDVKFSGNIFADSLAAHPSGTNGLFEVVTVDSTGRLKSYPLEDVFLTAYSGGQIPGANGFDCKKELGWGKPLNSYNGVISVSQSDDLVKCPADGNVGIGTYAPEPSSKLDVIGDVAFSGSRLHVGYDGKVGVGTHNPSERFEVSGGVKVWGNLSTHGDVNNFNSTSGDHLCTSFDGSSVLLDYKPQAGNAAGRFLINTQSRKDIVLGSHTQVWGQLSACKVVVESASWCDYVFEENYELYPLLDLEKYLKENKHLPNIPPASEIEEQGIDIAQMTRLHMQKIEELTLYVIELQKQIEELKTK
jgi:hypothetical protein